MLLDTLGILNMYINFCEFRKLVLLVDFGAVVSALFNNFYIIILLKAYQFLKRPTRSVVDIRTLKV